MRKRSELLFNLILVPMDALALLSSFVLAYIIRVEYSLKPTVYQIPGSEYLAALVFLLPVAIALFALAGLYSFESTRSRWREYSRVFIATSASTMFLIIVDFFSTKPIFPSKAVVIYGYVLACLTVILERFILNGLQRWLFRYKIGVRQVAVVGEGGVADDITYSIQRQPGYHLVATVASGKTALALRMSSSIIFNLPIAIISRTNTYRACRVSIRHGHRLLCLLIIRYLRLSVRHLMAGGEYIRHYSTILWRVLVCCC